MTVRILRKIRASRMKRSVGVLFLGVLLLSAPSALAQTPIRVDPATCPLPPAGGSVTCIGPDGRTITIFATPREGSQQQAQGSQQQQAPGGGCLAANGSVCSGQGTAIDGSVSSGCSTAVDDATASGGNCSPNAPQPPLVPPQLQRVPESPPIAIASPTPPSAPRQLALTG
jgi:hypothetical protein